MTQWDNRLHSEWEGFWHESHWCTRSYCGNQRYYEAPGGLRVVLEVVLWLTSSEWGCLLVTDSVLALVQPNGWLKKSLNKLYIFLVFLLLFSINKQISIAVLIVFQGLYPCTIAIKPISHTAWKVSKYGVISGLHFALFGLNTEIYSVNLRIQSEYSEMRSRNNSVSGHF